MTPTASPMLPVHPAAERGVLPRVRLQQALHPIARRVRYERSMYHAWCGFACGCGAALVGAAVLRWLQAESLLVGFTLLAPLVGWLVGAFLGALRPVSWRQVAWTIDRRQSADDAVTTAWHLSQTWPLAPMAHLQVEKTIAYLRHLQLTPQHSPWSQIAIARAVTAWLLALVVGVWPAMTAPVTAVFDEKPLTPAQTAELATHLETHLLEELRDLARRTKTPSPDLQVVRDATRAVQEAVTELRQSQPSIREALQKISQLEGQLQRAQRDLSQRENPAWWNHVQESLERVEPFQPLAESLAANDYQAAVERLRDLDPSHWDPQKVAEWQEAAERQRDQARQADDESLAQLMDEISQGLAETNQEAFQAATRSLHEQLASQAARQALQGALASQLEGLSQAKGLARSGGKNIADSTEDLETWGQGRAGDPLKEPTARRETERQREQLVGRRAEGPAERVRGQADHELAPETSQLPLRSLPIDYQRAAEQAWQSEHFPASHRRTIRNYFRSIHPD